MRIGKQLKSLIAITKKYRKRECIKELREYIFGMRMDTLADVDSFTRSVVERTFALLFGLVIVKGWSGFLWGDVIAGFTPFVIGIIYYNSGRWKRSNISHE